MLRLKLHDVDKVSHWFKTRNTTCVANGDDGWLNTFFSFIEKKNMYQ